MAQVLKNEKVEVRVDLPGENYAGSRFDWTGKIAEVRFNGKLVSGTELAGPAENPDQGRGFYNEFGIDTPIGFDGLKTGEWFHKIGIGLLQKEGPRYDFQKPHPIKPAKFELGLETDKYHVKCTSPSHNGYAYLLEKEIRLLDSGFEIRYRLENKGEKALVTNEYNHNFITLDRDAIGKAYRLSFPFPIRPERFGETVNPDGLVNFGEREIGFTGHPRKPFFFSNLAGGQPVEARWELIHAGRQLGISETGNFQTRAINLWGSGHVVSPELFIELNIPAGQSRNWSRVYQVFETG